MVYKGLLSDLMIKIRNVKEKFCITGYNIKSNGHNTAFWRLSLEESIESLWNILNDLQVYQHYKTLISHINV